MISYVLVCSKLVGLNGENDNELLDVGGKPTGLDKSILNIAEIHWTLKLQGFVQGIPHT